MLIVVRNKEERPHHLYLILPLRAIKWKWISTALASGDNVSIDYREFHQKIIEAYDAIKAYVKKNGHFDFVKVDTRDGTHVRIRI